jgi:primosomal protein N' (replication factor Y)
VLAAMASGNRDAVYAAEWAKREAAELPPFARLAAVILSSRDEKLVHAFGEDLAADAPQVQGVHVWGPAPAPLAMIRGQTRLRFAIHAGKTISLQAYLRAWLADVKVPASVSMTIDIDPLSFL